MIRQQSKKRPLKKLPKIVTAGARYAKRLAVHLRRQTRSRRTASLSVVLLLVLSGSAWGQSLNDAYLWSLVGGRQVGKYRPILTTYVAEGSNQYFTNARARAALSAISPLSYNSSTGAFSLTGLSSLGTANQLPGMNSGGTGFEYKTLSGSVHIQLTHGPGTLAWSLIAESIGADRLDTNSVGSSELIDESVTSPDVQNGSLALVDHVNGVISRRFQLTLGIGDSIKVYVPGAASTWTAIGGFVSGQNADGTIFGYCKTDTAVFTAEFGQPVANNKIWAIIGKDQ